MTHQNTYARIQSVLNIGPVMKAVASGGSMGATVEDIAEAASMKDGTARSYLASLEDLGYIKRIGKGRYGLGMGLALFYAKIRSIKESEIRRASNDLEDLGITAEVTIHER
jgi:DNA-binding IclR family transcriptional regulator